MASTSDYQQPPEQNRNFQPRVEAEEGDPTRGDFVIAAVVALVVIVGLLWAFGVINL
ncbi:MAG: hypothetical protein ACRDI2_20650 [Chloroflexota bacterium]